MKLEDAFTNVKTVSREFQANADTHDKIKESLDLIETILFPERFDVKKIEEEVKD